MKFHGRLESSTEEIKPGYSYKRTAKYIAREVPIVSDPCGTAVGGEGAEEKHGYGVEDTQVGAT